MKANRIMKNISGKIKQSTLLIIFTAVMINPKIIFAQTDDVSLVSEDSKSILEKPIEFSFPKSSPQDSTQESSTKYKVKISGVLQVHFQHEFNTNGDSIHDPDGFRILRARLIAKGELNKYISYQVMIDPRAPEIGGILRDAFIEFHIMKNQNIRVGQQKTQFGWENRQSITELYVVNRAEFSDNVSRGENLRDIGLGMLGFIPINKKFRFEDAVTFTNGTRSNVTGPYDFNSKTALWGRVGLRYKNDNVEMRIGGSFGYGGIRYLGNDRVDPGDDIYTNFNRMGGDAEVENKLFFIVGE